jgi:hypothetical protein
VVKGYGKLPLSFEVNQGQTESQVKFLSRGRGYSLFLTPTEAVLVLQRPSAESKVQSQKLNGETGGSSLVPRHSSLQGAVLRLKLLGVNPAPAIAGLDELPGKSNYFIGNDPKKWRTDVPNYAKVQYKNVYPGVDLLYYGGPSERSEDAGEPGRQLEYDFVVAPGADPKAIRLEIRGAKGIKSDREGNLVLRIKGGEVRFRKPLVYQLASNAEPRTPRGASSTVATSARASARSASKWPLMIGLSPSSSTRC